MKNRYARGSKLSEHKFLRLLQGYADGLPMAALEPTTHVSAKTIRAAYAQFRAALPRALAQAPDRFGGAALVLAHQSAPEFLAAIRLSRLYQRHRRDHAPRLYDPDREDQLCLDLAVRMLCALDLRVANPELPNLLGSLTLALPNLRPRGPLQQLAAHIPGARPHAHPGHRLFEDYRRVLLRTPLP